MKARIWIDLPAPGQMAIGCEIPQGEWPADPAQWTAEQHFLNYIMASTVAFIKTMGEVLPQHAAMMERVAQLERGTGVGN